MWKSWNNWLEGKGVANNTDPMVSYIMKHNKLNQKQSVDVLKGISNSRKSPTNMFSDYSQFGIEGRLGENMSRKMGSIEYSRPIDLPFYDVDPERVITSYILNANKRLAEIKNFGMGDELLKQSLEKMVAEGGDGRLAANLIDHLTGRIGRDPAFGFISDTASQNLRGVQVITKLGLASIRNASQSANTAMFTNIRDTARNLSKYVFMPDARRQMQSEAIQMGSSIPGAMSDLMKGLGSDGSIRLWGRTISPHSFLSKTGFLAVERMNRVVSAHAAKDFALRIAKEYGTMTASELKSSHGKLLGRTLKRLGQDPNKVIKKGGILNFNDFAKAARITESATQFETGLMDLPLFWSSPEGKILTQFKPFAFKQAQLMKKMFIDEAMKGNMKPLITAVIALPIIGEMTEDTRSILTFRKRNAKGLERLAENAAAIGAGGMFQDILQQEKMNNLPNFLMGPTASDFSKAVDAGIKAAMGKRTKLENMLLKNTPVAGPALMNLRRSNIPPNERLKQILEGAKPQ
jgi:hypothetical protein